MVFLARSKSGGTRPNFLSVISSARRSSGLATSLTRLLRNSLIFSLVMKSQGTGWRKGIPETLVSSSASGGMRAQSLAASPGWAGAGAAAEAAPGATPSRIRNNTVLSRNGISPQMPGEDERCDERERAAGGHGGAGAEASRQSAGRQAAERSQTDHGHGIQRHDAPSVFVWDQGLYGGVRRGHLPHHAVTDDGHDGKRQIKRRGKGEREVAGAGSEPAEHHHLAQSGKPRAARQGQRADDGADAHGAHENAEAARAAVENIVGEKRHEDQARHAGERGGTHQGEHPAHGTIMAGIAEAIHQVPPHGRGGLGRGGWDPHGGQAEDDGEEADAVD